MATTPPKPEPITPTPDSGGIPITKPTPPGKPK